MANWTLHPDNPTFDITGGEVDKGTIIEQSADTFSYFSAWGSVTFTGDFSYAPSNDPDLATYQTFPKITGRLDSVALSDADGLYYTITDIGAQIEGLVTAQPAILATVVLDVFGYDPRYAYLPYEVAFGEIFAGDDVITGTDNSEFFTGARAPADGNDIITPRGGNDIVFLGEGNDSVFAGTGVDFYLGGNDPFSQNTPEASALDNATEIDTVVFAGDASLYVIENADTYTYAGAFDDYFAGNTGDFSVINEFGENVAALSLEKIASGGVSVIREQEQTSIAHLDGIERLQFEDQTLALDVGQLGAAGQVYRIYEAAFDRAPDTAGFAFWVSEFAAQDFSDPGFDPLAESTRIAEYFLQSEEFIQKFGAPDTLGDTEFLTLLYDHVFDREADIAGLQFWEEQLQGETTRADVLAHFAQSDEHVNLVAESISEGIWF